MVNRSHSGGRRPRWHHLSILGLVVSGALLTPSVSTAESWTDRHRALILQAEAALKAHHHLEALAVWRVIWELEPSYEIAFNIGRMSLKLGSASDAATFLTRCLQLAPEAMTPNEKKRLAGVRADLKEARTKVAAVRILASKPGAQIAVDGAKIGVAPLDDEVFLMPGEHRITAALEGHDLATLPIQAEAGESRILNVRLTKSRPKAPPPLASAPKLVEPWRPPWLFIGTASTGVVGLGLGAVFTVASNSASTDASNAIPGIRGVIKPDCVRGSTLSACTSYLSASEARQTYAAVAAGGFIGAGLAGIASTVLLFYPRAPITPVVGGNSGFQVSLW